MDVYHGAVGVGLWEKNTWWKCIAYVLLNKLAMYQVRFEVIDLLNSLFTGIKSLCTHASLQSLSPVAVFEYFTQGKPRGNPLTKY